MEYQGTNLTETVEMIASLGADRMEAQMELAKKAEIVDLYGRKYLYQNGRLEEIRQPEPLRVFYPATFKTFTLDGLVRWIMADNDRLFAKENPAAMVVVTSPTKVCVMSHAQGERKERIPYAVCEYEAPRIPMNNYLDSEELFVRIQTCFLADTNRDVVLKVVNNMTEEQSAQTSDDGISQRVTIKSGLQEVDKTVFKNPAFLRPMRTFTEVDQPMSPFVVRFKEGKQAALFEADGGKWMVGAVRNVGAYLSEKLKDCNVVVIA